jgi:hypothetical protein
VIECGSLEYAQARLDARHGQRLREADWHRIELLREFGPLLEAARGTSLRPWLDGITAESSVHQVEAILRRRWRGLVAEVAGWMPASWRPALAWCAVLPDLAPLQQLAGQSEAAPWMRDDSMWRELCAVEPAGRPARLAAGPLAALAVAWSAPQTLARAWQAEWLRRWPAHRRSTEATLQNHARTQLAHEGAFVGADPAQGWVLRGALRARLALLLRRATLEPAAAFIHLALCALDLERLRAELLRRLVFARTQGA